MKYSFFILVILFTSCETISRIKKQDINPITNEFAGTYDNKPYFIRAKYGVTNSDSSITAVKLFDTSKTRRADLDHIRINFNTKGWLNLSYKDTSVFQPLLLNGRFSRQGYYEIYFNKKKIEIPPVVHFLFSTHNINRLRIYQTKNKDLVICEYDFVSGNLLFAGGEGPDKKQFFFHRAGMQ
ncbi:hypothetical protein A8C56_04525 [Niabella ginsenosidivorans]|uniref:Lipoprotein n=1 Tax=Niabella ginsenosidivorans TaxID=1176587 RepID=A0A1A9I0U6_9BACT|nr:hypothetical protein [Niabella ginsenosidivorans]ANH80341.1 hypothetical protein A8C56_04525 [Niabella ginsenosidivorans]